MRNVAAPVASVATDVAPYVTDACGMPCPVTLSVTWSVNIGRAVNRGTSSVASTRKAGTTKKAILTGQDGPDQRRGWRRGEIDPAVVEWRRALGIVATRSKRIGDDFGCIDLP